jgi:ketosteroid isomerase-like protein
MRCFVLCLLALPILIPLAFAQASAAAQPKSGDENAIQRIESSWLTAERNTDPAVLERVLSDDYVNLSPEGIAPGKAQLLKNFQAHAGEAPPYSVETRDMRIYILGDTAVAAYVKIYTAKETGSVAREDSTHIFTRDHGIWKLRVSRASVRSSE